MDELIERAGTMFLDGCTWLSRHIEQVCEGIIDGIQHGADWLTMGRWSRWMS